MADSVPTPHYPAFLDVKGRLCVVVGGGSVAERKARSLVACGADVAVITARPSEELLEMNSAGELTVEQRGYVRGDLENAFLALCTDPSDEVGRAVAAEAEERGCLVNVANAPELCSFILPSVVRREGLQIAVSTGGASPETARLARARLRETFGEEWGAYVALMAEVRALVFERHGDGGEGVLLARAADARVLERLAAGERLSAKSVLRELEARAAEPANGGPEREERS